MDAFIKRFVIAIVIMFFVTFFIISMPLKFISNYEEIITGILLTLFLLLVFWVGADKEPGYKRLIQKERIPGRFKTIYKELYDKYIISLEKMRKSVMWITIIQYISMFVALVGCMFEIAEGEIVSTKFDDKMTWLGALGFISAIILFVINLKYKKRYAQEYKKNIINAFIKLINNQLDYNPLATEESMIEADYKQANFDNKKFNVFNPDDYLEGFADEKTFIKMCDLNIKQCKRIGNRTYTEKIFQGIFANTKCGKNIGTYVRISKNKIKMLKKTDRVEMDSTEFEKYFDIYSENKIVSMQILTSEIMEELIEFYNKYQIKYEIVFRENTIYMRFFTGAMFEPAIFDNSMDKKLLFIYFCIFKFIVNVTEKVNKVLQEVEI